MVRLARGLLNPRVGVAKDDDEGEQWRMMRSLVQTAMVRCEENDWQYFVKEKRWGEGYNLMWAP
jgi:hypothetical protein